jgi:hypothetical protein
VAFYGSGDRDGGKIYFLKGGRGVFFNPATGRVELEFALEDRFPALSRFIARPQLFLVEDYDLETFVGEPQIGRLVNAGIFVPQRAKQTVRLVVESEQTTATSLRQNILQSQDSTVMENFYDEMKEQEENSGTRGKYDYHLDASFHGEAGATSLWGGEVDASLHARGGSEDVRSDFAKATFKTVSSQVNETSRQVNQQVLDTSSTYQRTDKTISLQEMVIDNTTSDNPVRYQFFEQLQPFLTLLVLKRVRVAYTDGKDVPRLVELAQLRRLLADCIPDSVNRTKVINALQDVLSNVLACLLCRKSHARHDRLSSDRFGSTHAVMRRTFG